MKKILTISLFAILFFCSNSNAQTESSALKVPYSFTNQIPHPSLFVGIRLKLLIQIILFSAQRVELY